MFMALKVIAEFEIVSHCELLYLTVSVGHPQKDRETVTLETPKSDYCSKVSE